MLQKLKTVLLSKKQLTHDVYEFSFLCKEPDRLFFEPGQYLILNVPKNNDKIKRLYSIFNFEKNQNNFKITVKLIPNGVASEYLLNLKNGDEVEFEGPAGLFILNKNEKDKIFLATGTGIMPILSIIFSNVKDAKSKIVPFWGLRKKVDIFYYDLPQQLAKNNNNFTFGIFISRDEIQQEAYIHSGRINLGIDKTFSEKLIDINNLEFYLCGSALNVDPIKNYLIEKGIKVEDIKMEKFG